MATRNIGIVIDGATGRLGTTQHLRSLMTIRSEGGLLLASGDRLIPEPVLMGRDPSGPTKAVIEVAAPAMLGAIMAFP